MVAASQNRAFVVGLSVLVLSIPSLYLFFLLSVLASVTLSLELCDSLQYNTPAKVRVLVAKYAVCSAIILISINMLLRFFKIVHVFDAHGINVAIERLELRCLFGIFSLGIAMLRIEVIQVVCLTVSNHLRVYIRSQNMSKVIDDSKESSTLGNLLILGRLVRKLI